MPHALNGVKIAVKLASHQPFQEFSHVSQQHYSKEVDNCCVVSHRKPATLEELNLTHPLTHRDKIQRPPKEAWEGAASWNSMLLYGRVTGHLCGRFCQIAPPPAILWMALLWSKMEKRLGTNFIFLIRSIKGFPGSSVVKNPPANAGDMGSIPELGRSPGERNGNPSSILAWKIPWT